MSYVFKTLSEGEKIQETIKLHWINYIIPWSLGILSILIAIAYLLSGGLANNPDGIWIVAFFVLWAIYAFLKVYTIEMVITNKRVIFKKGIISVKTDELKNSKIEAVEQAQSIMGRILGYGTISFCGTGGSVVYFKNVSSPYQAKSKAEEVIGN